MVTLADVQDVRAEQPPTLWTGILCISNSLRTNDYNFVALSFFFLFFFVVPVEDPLKEVGRRGKKNNSSSCNMRQGYIRTKGSEGAAKVEEELVFWFDPLGVTKRWSLKWRVEQAIVSSKSMGPDFCLPVE